MFFGLPSSYFVSRLHRVFPLRLAGTNPKCREIVQGDIVLSLVTLELFQFQGLISTHDSREELHKFCGFQDIERRRGPFTLVVKVDDESKLWHERD